MAAFMEQDPISYHVFKQYLQHDPESGSPRLEAWQMMSEIPTSYELLAVDPPPLPQISWEETPSKKEYLGFQYTLNRYEGTELLRRAVGKVRSDPNMMEDKECCIYSQVHVQGYTFAKSGAACKISFSTERSPYRVIWGHSERLKAGTLVALSPSNDNFESRCFVAVVAARFLCGGVEPDPSKGENENTPPRIDIFWADHIDAILDPSMELIMVEAKGGFFESVRHTLVGLQHSAFYESKFDKYIIDGYDQFNMAEYANRWPTMVPDDASMFDHSQRESFNRMTSAELAIVQGPPGTGKTFTSIMAVRSYIQTLMSDKESDEPPIIVAAQTNHALDQLLEKCIQANANIVRFGGRSKIAMINECSMFNLAKWSKVKRGATKGEIARKTTLAKLNNALSMGFPTGVILPHHLLQEDLITQQQFDSLNNDEWETAESVYQDGDDDDEGKNTMATWLADNIEQDRTYVYYPPQGQKEPEECALGQEKSPEDDDMEVLKGEFVSTEFYWTGSVPEATSHASWYSKARKLLSRHSDLYGIKPPQRGMVYRYLRHRMIEKIANRLPEFLKQYEIACREIKANRWNRELKILQTEGVEVVGCTTTGLNKYRGLLAALQPRILMIEEAAETQEANITSALYPSLEQLVLVGDHQQLVPSVSVRELEISPYSLNKSLFERLVEGDIPYSMLKVQRRMIPLLRSVVHTFYPLLEDHDTVKDPRKRPPVPGMGGQNLWWFQHQWGESRNANFSCYNENEAAMIVGFVRYLVLNRVEPSQITILTYYKGQVSVILSKLKRDPVLIGYPSQVWAVRTVDGFQGEENDVIILSLVRSPSSPHGPSNVGFVKNENRAVVATSRARRGMYLFGNSNNILNGGDESAQTWQKVYNVFVEEKCIGYKIPVVCKNHGRVTNVCQPEDWEKILWGGYEQPCDETCPRGHPCKQPCHSLDQSMFKCTNPCEAVFPCGHKCNLQCGDACRCPNGCDQPAFAKASLPLEIRPARQGSTPDRISQSSYQSSNKNETSRGSARGRGKSRGGGGGGGGRGGRGRGTGRPNRSVNPAGNQQGFAYGSFSTSSQVSQDESVSQDAMSIQQQHEWEPTSEELMQRGYNTEARQLDSSMPREISRTTESLDTSPDLISLEPVDTASHSSESLSDR